MNSYHYITSALLLVVSILSYQYLKDQSLDTIRSGLVKAVDKFISTTMKSREDDQLKLHLATIDMTEAQKNSSKAAKQLFDAMKNVGFAYLVNVPGFRPDELFEATTWLFNQPLETKMDIAKKAFNSKNKNLFRGYFPVIPGGHSYKEAYEIGGFFDDISNGNNDHDSKLKSEQQSIGRARPLMRDVVSESNVWPNSANATENKRFENVLRYNFNFYSSLAEKIMHLLAEGLGLEAELFDNMFGQKQLSTLRLLHYPSRVNFTDVPDEAKDGDTLITTGEHFDTAFLTILAAFENKGLQVKLSQNGPWLDVPPHKHALVINIGKLLSDIVNNELMATNHRVIDLGTDRYSVPFFYEPNFDGDISKTIDGKLINPVFQKYGPWMTNRTSQFVEYATTDFGIAD
eukprot:gene165-777_t